MTERPNLPPDLNTNPEWLIHDYNFILREFRVAKVSEPLYREEPFLDHRIQSKIKNFYTVSFEQMNVMFEEEINPSRAAAYIFHMGRCGSTLLSRALGVSSTVLSLREPQLLNVLAGLEREKQSQFSWISKSELKILNKIVHDALERRFRPDQQPLVKAKSVCNNMIEPIMETHPARKAILVYQPLEAAIAGILKKQDMRSDIRTQSRTRLVEWADITGNEDLLLSEIRPEQAAAISWLGSMHRFGAAVEEFGDRAMPVNFEDFLEQPVEWLERIARFLGLEAVAQEIVQGYESVSGRYSKNTAWSYGPGKRAEQLERSREANAAMIDAGLKFAEVQLDRYPQLLVSKVRA